MSKMQHIDAASLNHLPSRVSYLQSFVTFDHRTDGPRITSLKALLVPLLPTLLDAVYTHLLTYDITARSFLPAQTSTTYQSGMAEADVTALHLNHANIRHRQDFLRAYLVRLLSNQDWSPESRFWGYLDRVGAVHTGKERTARSKSELRVEYVHIAALLAWLQDQIVGAVMGAPEGEEGQWTVERKTEALRALGRFLWIQNDLFARHYVEERVAAEKERDFLLAKEVVRIGAAAAVAGVVMGALLAWYLLT